METNYELELYHHGVKGQKWGIRRYQKADGSLTLLGKRRQKKIEKTRAKNLEKAREAKANKKKAAAQSQTRKKKSISEMTDDELRSAIQRKELEQRYSQLNPKQISKGEKFVKTFMNDMVVPAATDLGRQAVKSGMVKGLNEYVIRNLLGDNAEYKVYTNNKKKN